MTCCNHDCQSGRRCPVRMACQIPETDEQPPIVIPWWAVVLAVFFLFFLAGAIAQRQT